MKILVDADAMPAKDLIETVAKTYALKLIYVVNHNHEIHSTYAETVVVDPDADAADYRLVSLVEPRDIVLTQDYGLAALMLAKETTVVHPNGWVYTKATIETLLDQRHRAAKNRKKTGRYPTIAPRNKNDNQRLQKTLITIIDSGGEHTHD